MNAMRIIIMCQANVNKKIFDEIKKRAMCDECMVRFFFVSQ